jgi:hypothetical protein
LSLAEVQQGQAQSLLPKKIIQPIIKNKQSTPGSPSKPQAITPDEKETYEDDSERQPTTNVRTGGYIPIQVKEGIPRDTWKSDIPEWKYGPAKNEAIQPATGYRAYKKSVAEVRNAPAGTIISTTKIEQKPGFMTKNIWQATYENAQAMFNPVKTNIQQDTGVEARWKTWEKLPFGVKQDIIRASSGTFDNPFGIYTWKYYFSGKEGEKQAFKEVYDPFMQKVGEKFKSPVSAAAFMTFETIPGAYYGFKGFSYGLGYVKSLGPAGEQIVKGVNRAVGTYFATETIKGASEATRQGPEALSRYIVSTGAMLGVAAFGMKSFKAGELAGFRKRVQANLRTPEGIARADAFFKAFELRKNISSKNITPLDLNRVENLRGDIVQQTALKNALASPEMKRYKVALGGSAAGFESSPHDIDILVKKSIGVRSPINSGSLQSPIAQVSNVPKVESILKSKGVNLSLFDIHDLPKVGESFPQAGTGVAEKPIRTAPGSAFKWQISLSEQAGRKLASAWAPLHEFRGKDWNTVTKIAEENWSTPIEIKPSQYAKILEQQGKVNIFKGISKERKLLFPGEDLMGVTIVPTKPGAFTPQIEIKYGLGYQKQTTYAHELLHLEPYLKTGKMGSESYAYWNEQTHQFFKPTLAEELGKWKPQLQGDKLVGPSFYEKNPAEVPQWEHTWFERQLRKYGKPMTSKDLFTPEAWKKFAKTDAEAYRPSFIEKPMVDPRAKGTIFWSGGYPLYEGGSKSRFPLAIPIAYTRPNTGVKKSSIPPVSPHDAYSPFAPHQTRTYPSENQSRYVSPFIENKKYPSSPVINSPYPRSPFPVEKYPSSPFYPDVHRKPRSTISTTKRPPFEELILEQSKKTKKHVRVMEEIGWLKELPIPTLKDLFGG